MREKLKQLGINLPPLPLTSVGSFPKPEAVLEARKNFPPGHPERKKAEEEATRFWIKTQEDLGYDVLVHGEMERGDMVAYFGETLGGMKAGNKEEPIRSYGNRFWIPPEINSAVEWTGHITIGSWKFAQSLTQKPTKGMLTGPATIYDWSLDGFYASRNEGVRGIAKALRKEIEALINAGARIIQIDEPSLAHTSRHFSTLLDAFRIMLEGLGDKAYFIMHTCYGEDVFEEIYPKMLELPVDNLDLETSNSEMGFLETIKKHPVIKDLSLGVVDVHSHAIEPVELVEKRISLALEVVPRERLWLDPDCGLKTRAVEEAIGKLKVISDARKSILQNSS